MEIPAGWVDVSGLLRSGVYILIWKDEVVYVGQSQKMCTRIATHVSAKGKPRKSVRGLPVMRFDRVAFMNCLPSDLDRVEKELIERYQPRYNIKRNPRPTPPMDLLLEMLPAPMLPPTAEPRQAMFRRR